MNPVQHYQVTIYEWPWSQNCMDCKFGEYMQSPTFNKACYFCFRNCTKNDGVHCPEKEKQS